MAGKKITIGIEAKDEASKPIDQVTKKLNSITKEAKAALQPLDNFGRSLKNIGQLGLGVGTIAAGVSAITKQVEAAIKTMLEWEKSFGAIEQTVKKIDFAATINKNLKASSKELQQFAADTSATMKNLFSQGELQEAMQSMLFDKTAVEIKKVITVATDLSSALGIDLKTAVTQLNSTMSGSVGTLGKMFPELKELTKESLEAGEAIQLIGEKVKGVSEEMSDTVNGSLLNYKNSIGDLKEELGYIITDFFTPIRNQIALVAKEWATALGNKRTLAESAKAIAEGKGTWDDYQVVIENRRKQADKLRAEMVGYKESSWYANLLYEGTPQNDIDTTVKLFQERYQVLITELDSEIRSLQDRQFVVGKNGKPVASSTGGKLLLGSSAGGTTIESPAEEKKYTPPSAGTGNVFGIKLPDLISAIPGAKDIINNTLQNVALALPTGQTVTPDYRTPSVSWYRENYGTSRGPSGMLSFNNSSIDFSSEGIFGQIKNVFYDVSEVVKGFGSSLFGSISSLQVIQNILNPMQTILSGAMDILSPMINDLLAPISNTLTIIGQTLGQLIVPALNMLSPAIQILTEGFMKLYNDVIVPVGNKWIEAVNAVVKGVTDIINYFIYYINKIFKSNLSMLSFTAAGSLASVSSSDMTQAVSVGAASYTAAKDVYVTLNINNSAVTGDLRSLALLIRDELNSINALGY